MQTRTTNMHTYRRKEKEKPVATLWWDSNQVPAGKECPQISHLLAEAGL